MKILTLGICLLAAVACGDSYDNTDSGSDSPEEETDSDAGNYTISFSQINPGIGANNSAGTGTIVINANTLSVQLNMTGMPPVVPHMQNIMTSSSCATVDSNGDLYVDVIEGTAAFGQILIPLDNNLNSQQAGFGDGPRAENGSYIYSQSANLERMLADLTLEDPDTNDPIVKLPEGENLNLENRVLIIHGVPSTVNLPASVASYPELESEATIPILCGKITRVNEGSTTGGTGSTTGGEEGTTTGTASTGI